MNIISVVPARRDLKAFIEGLSVLLQANLTLVGSQTVDQD
jgi:hypothetical protein